MIYNKIDIKAYPGLKIGKLTLIKRLQLPVNEKPITFYLCKCECGNKTTVARARLLNGHTKSCGCLMNDSIKHVEHADNTIISRIKSRKICSNNTTGARGVYWMKNCQKWRAVITFKKKVYHLGVYEDKDNAINARKMAERNMYDKFIKEYEKSKITV